MTRRQQKLPISLEERTIIKGLIAHTDLNDQMIVSIFSHASRTINHREIGYFRDATNAKYKDCPVATKAEIERFLRRYRRFERIAKAHGVIPQEDHFQLVQKAAEAIKAAVSIFNNPSIQWKAEIYIVNAIIAWTYLMHAYYKTKGIGYQYQKAGIAQLTDEGRPKLWELSKCLAVSECPLPTPVKKNLEYLIVVRNEIEHRLSDNVDRFIESKLQACALNFNYWMCEWFGQECSVAQDLAFAIQFAEISIGSQSELTGAKGLPSVIQTVNALVETKMAEADYNDPRYSYRVYVAPRTVNNKNRADQAVIYAQAGSDIEIAIREVERPKFTASQIVALMKKEGYSDFTLYGKGGFVELWKAWDARVPGKGYGVFIAGLWYWYDKMVGEVRAHLAGLKAKKI